MTIGKPFKEHAEKQPHKPAIVNDGQSMSYLDLYIRINRLARAILDNRKKLRLEKSEHRVAILLENRTEFLEVFLAAATIGSVAIVFDTKWTDDDLRRKINECRPSLLITDSIYSEKVRQANFPVIEVDKREYESWLQSFPADAPEVTVSPDDLFYMGYTSGTTGNPKGFVRTQESWVQTFVVSDEEFAITKNDHILCPGPFVHSLSLYAAIYSLYIGATFYVEPSFQVGKIRKLLENHPISVLYVVPTMLKLILRQLAQRDKHHLRKMISSGDKLDPSIKTAFAAIFPEVDLYEFYGASELSFVSVLDPEGNRTYPESVGRFFSNVSASIRDEHGKEVQPGEIGTLYVKSPMVFSHYFNNPEETAAVFEDGWATVGDLARRDADGYLYLAGRKKNMIIGGGLNIYPEEVEKVILQFPDVEDAVVIGLSDDLRGEKVVAVVTGKNGTQLDSREIKRFCRGNLPKYKCPKEIHCFADFPYTSSGKIARNEVKRMLVEGRAVCAKR